MLFFEVPLDLAGVEFVAVDDYWDISVHFHVSPQTQEQQVEDSAALRSDLEGAQKLILAFET